MATSVFGCLRMTSFIILKLQLPLRSWCLSLPSHGGLTCQMQEEGAGRSPSPFPEPVSSALSEDSILPLSALSAPASGRRRVGARLRPGSDVPRWRGRRCARSPGWRAAPSSAQSGWCAHALGALSCFNLSLAASLSHLGPLLCFIYISTECKQNKTKQNLQKREEASLWSRVALLLRPRPSPAPAPGSSCAHPRHGGSGAPRRPATPHLHAAGGPPALRAGRALSPKARFFLAAAHRHSGLDTLSRQRCHPRIRRS